MSALGQKQTCAMQKPMSALPPKADIYSSKAWTISNPLELLPARSRNKAPDLRPTFIVLVRPNYGQPELVWYSY